jgi:ABC-type Fe3+ transport system permease subunit
MSLSRLWQLRGNSSTGLSANIIAIQGRGGQKLGFWWFVFSSRIGLEVRRSCRAFSLSVILHLISHLPVMYNLFKASLEALQGSLHPRIRPYCKK